MRAPAAAANVAWVAAALPGWRRFRAALRDPLSTQADLLARCLERNAHSSIGHEFGFGRMLSASRRSADPRRELLERYRARVPLTRYDAIEPYVQRIRSGEQNVLTSAVVRRLVPSSGSTSATKLLPFTADLQREFSRAIDPWIADLFLTHPAAARGRSYWSISPAVRRGDISSAVPIAFEDDSAYLGRAARALAGAGIAVPDAVARVTDLDAFRYITLVFLAAARDLSLISIWHPSFPTRLWEPLAEWLPLIAGDIASGILRPPGRVDPEVLAALRRRMRPDSRRGRELRTLASLEPRHIWPRLAVISCWADGAARRSADGLRRTMPGVAIQPKGLVATEGIVSIPFAGRSPLAIRSHFLEFIDEDGRARLVHELREGREYSVVLTTGGGLYRYQLCDRIVVDGAVSRTPSIRFVGRDDRVSDLFGEKLSDGFVSAVLSRLFADRPPPRFAMLAPVPAGDGVAYTLFVDGSGHDADLEAHLERELRRNVHYAWCVDLRQLRPARVVRVGPEAEQAFIEACVRRGQRLGDVKPSALACEGDWEAVFDRAARA